MERKLAAEAKQAEGLREQLTKAEQGQAALQEQVGA